MSIVNYWGYSLGLRAPQIGETTNQVKHPKIERWFLWRMETRTEYSGEILVEQRTDKLNSQLLSIRESNPGYTGGRRVLAVWLPLFAHAPTCVCWLCSFLNNMKLSNLR